MKESSRKAPGTSRHDAPWKDMPSALLLSGAWVPRACSGPSSAFLLPYLSIPSRLVAP